jgi:hypothetical protein
MQIMLLKRFSAKKEILSFASLRNIDVSNQILVQMFSLIDTSAENYFFGDLSAADKVALPENIKIFSPVTGSSNTIKFNYATVEDILTYNLESVFISKGILTIKTITKRDTVASTMSSIPFYPKMENYAAFHLIGSKRDDHFPETEGRHLKEKEIIAQKNSAQFFLDQVNLNDEKMLQFSNNLMPQLIRLIRRLPMQKNPSELIQ